MPWEQAWETPHGHEAERAAAAGKLACRELGVQLLGVAALLGRQRADSLSLSSHFLLNPRLTWVSTREPTSRSALDAGDTGKPSSGFYSADSRQEM